MSELMHIIERIEKKQDALAAKVDTIDGNVQELKHDKKWAFRILSFIAGFIGAITHWFASHLGKWLSLALLFLSLSVTAQFAPTNPSESSGGASAQDIATEIEAAKNNDAFGRLRTSGTGQRLDVEFIYDKQPDFIDESTNNGAVTFNEDSRDLTLSLSDANNGSYSLMMSHPVPYTPGNSQLIDVTGVLDLANIGGYTEVFLRSSSSGSTTEERIKQSNWTASTSGVDWSKSHIFQMDFQSLKVGSIRYSLVTEGAAVQVAKIDNDNEINRGYWQLPSLPIMWRIYTENDSTYMEIGYGDELNAIGFRHVVPANASATLKAICGSVKSEDGTDLKDIIGIPRAIDMGAAEATVSTTLIPLLSLRVKDSFNSFPNLGLAIPKIYNAVTNNEIKLVVIHDCDLTGASWVDVNSESFVEYDISASAFSDGHIVSSEYISAVGGGQNRSGSSQGLLGKTVLWNRKGDESGIITIAAIKTKSNNASVLVSFGWDEIR